MLYVLALEYIYSTQRSIVIIRRQGLTRTRHQSPPQLLQHYLNRAQDGVSPQLNRQVHVYDIYHVIYVICVIYDLFAK